MTFSIVSFMLCATYMNIVSVHAIPQSVTICVYTYIDMYIPILHYNAAIYRQILVMNSIRVL